MSYSSPVQEWRGRARHGEPWQGQVAHGVGWHGKARWIEGAV